MPILRNAGGEIPWHSQTRFKMEIVIRKHIKSNTTVLNIFKEKQLITFDVHRDAKMVLYARFNCKSMKITTCARQRSNNAINKAISRTHTEVHCT